MKSKNYKSKWDYRNYVHNIQIGIDDTDHIVFICNKCMNPLEVIEVFSKNIAITTDGKIKDNCTWIELVCNKCKSSGQRKFYWESEDGEFCWQRTYDPNKIKRGDIDG